ncbi:MAG: TSUP family transporter [Clostridiales bacterium]|nr:TSUP family transporter [Clostridiales bacterium]
MHITAQMLWTVCPLALLAGFIDAVAGGGGLISLPAYYLAGLPASMAAGTNKLSATMGTVLAVYNYGRSDKINKRIGLFSGMAAVICSTMGVLLMKQLPDRTVRILVMCCIPVAAAMTLRGRRNARPVVERTPGQVAVYSLLIGAAIGFYDGLVGPGTGTFLILLFIQVFALEDVTASGTAKVTNLCSNLAALTSLLLTGDVLWLLGLPAGACAMVGAAAGSRLTIRRGAKVVRGMMLCVLTLLLAKMITDMLQ